jgi:putative copper resistance protein D
LNTLYITVRAVHFASVMLLFGELVFAICVAAPIARVAQWVPPDRDEVSRGRLRVAAWSLCVSVVSSVAWLLFELADMSGMPMHDALTASNLGLVLGTTVFGRVWLLRWAIAVALGVMLLIIWRSSNAPRPGATRMVAATALAAVYLGSLSGAGHAAAGPADEVVVHLPADMLHLLAAGAWLGALPGLAYEFGRALRMPPATLAVTSERTRRFSALGVVCVGMIVLTGGINSWYMIGDVPALVGTAYGRLLVLKLALVAAMIALALVNRRSLAPKLALDDRAALRQIRRNTIAETMLGMAVVAVVGVLGTMIPAAHETPRWPFAWRLDLDAPSESVGIGIALVGVMLMAAIATVVIVRGMLLRRARLSLYGMAGMLTAAAIGIWLLAVPATPTTYLASPVEFTTEAIAQGGQTYARECARCHDPRGRQDNRAVAATAASTNLIEELRVRRPGDLFWSIAHGIPGTPMSAFSPPLGDTEIWELIQYLRALSELDDAVLLFGNVNPWRPVVAPDFTFETEGRGQESLTQFQGNAITILVLYTLPESLARLRDVGALQSMDPKAAVRVIAVPMTGPSRSGDADTQGADRSILAVTRPDVAATYAMFTRERLDVDNPAPQHAEFLIDRQGYLRARWIGLPKGATDRNAQLQREIDVLKRERPRATGIWAHLH